MATNEALSHAQRLWDYLRLDHPLRPSDLVLALGSHDLRVAERAARIFLDGWAPLLVVAGGIGRLTGDWTEPEADHFARVARRMGVPEDQILVENRSSNTGENVLFTRRLLAERGIEPRSVILVHKPYMARRAYATFRKQWPEPDVISTSPQIPFRDYPTDELPMDDIIHIMVGDFQRILLYPARGFQVPQEIPEEAMRAYEALVELGFTNHLIS